MARRKSWTEKLNEPDTHKITRITKDLAGMKSGQLVLIATPKIVQDYISRIPSGCRGNVSKMRSDLADEYGAEATCPLTTGIFLRIVAEAANEAHENGTPLSQTTPVWRIVDHKSPVLKNLSFDPAYVLNQFELEKSAAA
ncbi:MAG: hypothetical protein GY789_08040 [Hyphomicrobiales bacterium]|nr:hypothetical protein [Hyphomicrobiales bacterium]MCP4998040.1 hypothetical protein [Hyphomicrobiales bacterium]